MYTLGEKVELIKSHTNWGRKGIITKLNPRNKKGCVRVKWQIEWNGARIRNNVLSEVHTKNLALTTY